VCRKAQQVDQIAAYGCFHSASQLLSKPSAIFSGNINASRTFREISSEVLNLPLQPSDVRVTDNSLSL
jgi:hypothetical protein